ncbi:MAG: hypothetical protein IIA67_13730 [Planctomycetes bacterium]|nr:hypothetical protein [Planctomycetota bacterium]
MTDSPDPNERGPDTAGDFADQAEQPSPGIIREFVDFLRYNKKWWLTPILLVLLLVGTLVFLAGTSAAPLIYTFF